VFAPEQYYYSLPAWKIYKTYPIYVKGREPKAYLDSLRKLEPVEIPIDVAQQKTQEDGCEPVKKYSTGW